MIDDENQTVFAQEEPMIETGQPDLGSATDAAVATDSTGAALVPKKRTSPIKFVLVIVGVMLVLLLLVAAVAKKAPRQQVALTTPSPSANAKAPTQGELDTTLNLLHDDITKADPTVNDLPVPPINFKLALDVGN